VVQTPYLADLDPLDETPRHLLLTLPDPNGKDPSALCLRGLSGWFMGVGTLDEVYSDNLLSNET